MGVIIGADAVHVFEPWPMTRVLNEKFDEPGFASQE